MDMLANCRLCVRACGVNRLAGQRGFCRAGMLPRLALANLHRWEEPCISGNRGSGTVFFSGCNLACVYCQNQAISQSDQGTDVSVERLAEIFWEQQQRGAHNLNLVTPTPFVPQILTALGIARSRGFTLPVVYNTSSYETLDTIALLDGWVDVYLPDLKYYSDELACQLSKAPGYFRQALAVIRAMADQVGPCRLDAGGLIRRGLIVRHLALPGHTEDAKNVLAALRELLGKEVWFSLMNQYTPQPSIASPELRRPLSAEEYEGLIDYALSLGLENGFIQEGGTATESFIPEFNLDGVTRKGAQE